VRVRDVGRVHFAPLIRQGAVTRDGRGEVVTGIVMMLVGANGREVVEDVKARIAQIEPIAAARRDDRRLLRPRGAREPHDPTVGTNLAEGALFVIAVLFLLLGSIRGGLIVAAAIPFAMLVAFTAMKALGLSGNLMSLGAIDFGIVVDGSIIVVENAVVHLAAAARGLGRPMTYGEAADVVLGSTLDVRKAALFGEAIIVIVYVPILTLAGVEGKMFKPMAITVLFALLGAFIASLTFVPVLVATFLRQHTGGERAFLVRLLHRVYPRLLLPAMRAPVRDRLACAARHRIGVASRMGAEFVPRLDEGAIAIQVLRLPSVSLEESVRGATRFEKVLREFPEVVTVVSKTGRAEIATDPMGVELSDAIVILKPHRRVDDRDHARSAGRAHVERLTRGAAGTRLLVLAAHRAAHGGAHQRHALRRGDHDLRRRPRDARAPQPADPAAVRPRGEGATDVRGEQLAGLPTLDVTSIARPRLATASPYATRSTRSRPSAGGASARCTRASVASASRCACRQSLRDDIDQMRTSRSAEGPGRSCRSGRSRASRSWTRPPASAAKRATAHERRGQRARARPRASSRDAQEHVLAVAHAPGYVFAGAASSRTSARRPAPRRRGADGARADLRPPLHGVRS
jgi:cobalt-zinc-cadmium resistance protein CzcA